MVFGYACSTSCSDSERGVGGSMTGAPGGDGVDAVVSAQLRREPRQPWRVAVRCPHDRPAVLATPPRLADGTPFPTLFWLSCPELVARIGGYESAGGTSIWVERLAGDRSLVHRALVADAAYRAARAIEGGGEDPCAEVGIAGLRDPLKTKCLHAHAAAYLAGIPDPIGEDAVEHAGGWCEVDQCAALDALARVETGAPANLVAKADA